MTHNVTPTRTAKVFIPSRFDKHNVTDAARFGTIVYLDEVDTAKTFSPFAPDDFITQTITRLKAAQYSNDVDHLVLGGRILTCVLTTVAVHKMVGARGNVNLLMFDAQRDCYVAKRLNGVG